MHYNKNDDKRSICEKKDKTKGFLKYHGIVKRTMIGYSPYLFQQGETGSYTKISRPIRKRGQKNLHEVSLSPERGKNCW